ncbi:penicillin-binding transpeptidase domain-containing protein [Rhodococcus sp. HNM0569]|uniref:penicillin-binding transpeptidase domain-containing protein n=1 Tax=Rhodococcus sp. HNM0569 TaxID=2716340 RepID=UPI003211D768
MKAVTLVTVLAATLTACGLGGPDQPDTVAQQFADALAAEDVPAAAALTTDPQAATDAITALFDGLGDGGTFTPANPAETDGGGTVDFDVAWTFDEPRPEDQAEPEQQAEPAPQTPPREWTYTTRADVVEDGDDWRIDWDPAVLAPGLTADSAVRYTPTQGTPAAVRFASGQPLMEQQTVTVVQYDQSADVAALAATVQGVAPTITADSLRTQLAEHRDAPATAITLRADDFAPLEPALSAMPGVTLVPQTRLLTVDKSLTSPVFGGLVEDWQRNNDAAAGWAVQLVGPDGTAETVAGADPETAPDTETTFDAQLQSKAESALAGIPQDAAIVALRPSTGELVAAAQNAPADAQGALALTGLYPPGSTFKTVTTTAALESGAVTPDTVLPCPGTENIEGRQIPNDEEFDLGEVPLHTAFARSCNTTMGRLAVSMAPNQLHDTALQLGLGVDFVTPGLTTVTGSVPSADTPAARVESAIGQGQVTASPFGMAVVAASIAHGSVPAPTVLRGQPGTPDQTPPAVDPAVLSDVRSMMRETVTGGTATSLRDVPDLLGKTGTAEDGTGSAHGWFVGISGDLAFAVFVADADSSGPALQAAGSFLR